MYKAFFIILLCMASFAQKPKYEIGLAGLGINAPHYPASTQSQTRHVVLPAFIIRTKYFTSDEEGVRGRLGESSLYKFTVSLGAAFPSSAEDNRARKGMKDLDWLGEVGPRLDLTLYQHSEARLDLRLQSRFVFSTDFDDLKVEGFVYHPMLYYEDRNFFNKKLQLILRAGAVWANEGVMDYFYQVEGSAVTSHRPYYNSKSGFIQTHTDIGFAYRASKKLLTYIGIKRNYFGGTRNWDSPLHLKNHFDTVGVAFIWKFYQSKTLADI